MINIEPSFKNALVADYRYLRKVREGKPVYTDGRQETFASGHIYQKHAKWHRIGKKWEDYGKNHAPVNEWIPVGTRYAFSAVWSFSARGWAFIQANDNSKLSLNGKKLGNVSTVLLPVKAGDYLAEPLATSPSTPLRQMINHEQRWPYAEGDYKLNLNCEEFFFPM